MYTTHAHLEPIIGPGRPRYLIREETILYFRNMGFNWNQISAMLLASRWTLRRRVVELGLEGVVGYSDISDNEIDSIIHSFKQTHGLVTGRSLIASHTTQTSD